MAQTTKATVMLRYVTVKELLALVVFIKMIPVYNSSWEEGVH